MIVAEEEEELPTVEDNEEEEVNVRTDTRRIFLERPTEHSIYFFFVFRKSSLNNVSFCLCFQAVKNEKQYFEKLARKIQQERFKKAAFLLLNSFFFFCSFI